MFYCLMFIDYFSRKELSTINCKLLTINSLSVPQGTEDAFLIAFHPDFAT